MSINGTNVASNSHWSQYRRFPPKTNTHFRLLRISNQYLSLGPMSSPKVRSIKGCFWIPNFLDVNFNKMIHIPPSV